MTWKYMYFKYVYMYTHTYAFTEMHLFQCQLETKHTMTGLSKTFFCGWNWWVAHFFLFMTNVIRQCMEVNSTCAVIAKQSALGRGLSVQTKAAATARYRTALWAFQLQKGRSAEPDTATSLGLFRCRRLQKKEVKHVKEAKLKCKLISKRKEVTDDSYSETFT